MAHGHRPWITLFDGFDPLEEFVKTATGVADIEFFGDFAIRQAGRHKVTITADINGHSD